MKNISGRKKKLRVDEWLKIRTTSECSIPFFQTNFDTSIFFQEMIASHTSYVSNFYKYASQKSAPIYLHKGEKYYYEAFMGDYGHYYRFEMGLFGRRTEHTKALTDKAQDEIQQIRISTQKVPRIMVRDILYRGLFF